MMRLKVTHLKAPWPVGTAVGDVVELAADAVPQWAVGKCTATDEAANVFTAMHEGDEGPALDPLPESIAEAEAQAADERRAIEADAKKARRPAKG